MTTEAAAAGAQIVAHQEYAIIVSEADYERIRAELARIAAEDKVWLSLPYAWIPTTGKGENRHLLIDDDGVIQIDYQKRYPLGIGEFGESGVFEKGSEVIQTTDSPFGRIAVAICRDMSFPRFARQAGQAEADIMLTGSHEFPKGVTLNDPHRSIENGFTHVRTTYDGISYAMDPYGQVLAQMDRGVGNAGIMYADVPTQGIRTLYARVGDWLSWLSVVALLVLATRAALARVAKESEPSSTMGRDHERG